MKESSLRMVMQKFKLALRVMIGFAILNLSTCKTVGRSDPASSSLEKRRDEGTKSIEQGDFQLHDRVSFDGTTPLKSGGGITKVCSRFFNDHPRDEVEKILIKAIDVCSHARGDSRVIICAPIAHQRQIEDLNDRLLEHVHRCPGAVNAGGLVELVTGDCDCYCERWTLGGAACADQDIMRFHVRGRFRVVNQ